MTPPLPEKAVTFYAVPEDAKSGLFTTGTDRVPGVVEYVALLRADMERLLAALALYADNANYREEPDYCGSHYDSEVQADGGRRARRALAPEGGSDA